MDPCTSGCNYQSFMGRFKVTDVDPADVDGTAGDVDAVKYEKLKLQFPMVYRHFKIDVEIKHVDNYNVYNDEKLSVNIMTNNDDNVQTFAFNTGAGRLGNKCTANLDPVADKVDCQGMVSSCFRETDNIIVNIMKAGNPLKETLKCSDIFDEVKSKKASGDKCNTSTWADIQDVLKGKGKVTKGDCTYVLANDSLEADSNPDGSGWIEKKIVKGEG